MANRPSLLLVVSTQLVSKPSEIARLQEDFRNYDVHQQLLERLAEDAIVLPASKFSRVHITDGTLSADLIEKLYEALVDNGQLTGESIHNYKAYLIVSGFVQDPSQGWIKKNTSWSTATPLHTKRNADLSTANTTSKLGQRITPFFTRAAASATSPAQATAFPRGISTSSPLTPPSEIENFNGGEDDLIDEDDLITEESIGPAYNFPPRCNPGPGKKRRRACKDCTCGLKEKEEAEAAQTRDSQSKVLLNRNDIAEIDFTVPGKAVEGCGSCALGDAFRCDGCPYLGLPPFKPGEIISVDQFEDDL